MEHFPITSVPVKITVEVLPKFIRALSGAERKVCVFDSWLICVWSQPLSFFSASQACWWWVQVCGGSGGGGVGSGLGVRRQAALVGWSCLSIDIQICPENTTPYVRDQGLAWFQHNHFTMYASLINKGAAFYFISLF